MDPRSASFLLWHDRLESARSAAEVVEACQEYVAQFTPEQLAGLPRDLLPPRELDAASIASYGVELARRDLAEGAASGPLLKALALFFAEASAAMARIAMARARRDGWAYVALRR